MTEKEALKLALEALEGADMIDCDMREAMTAILEVLAKPEQEPWSPVSIGVDVTNEGAHVVGIYAMTDNTSQVFYAKYYPVPKRTWVGLTDEEIWETISRIGTSSSDVNPYAKLADARAIEAKLKEKNT